MPAERLERYASAILSEAEHFDVDPFLLAALMYDQSRCWPRTPTRDRDLGRYGLTRVPLAMHAAHIRGGFYRYHVFEGPRWQERELAMDRHPYNKWKAAQVEPSLHFAAAILKVFETQSASLDSHFEGVPHRHFVSHWFYGDRVREVEPENRVLTARRRLLSYYANDESSRAGVLDDVPIVSPLDGVPRLVIDYFGNPRGKRGGTGHRGIDIDGALGEPVRAIAAGRVTFAGVDLPGPGQHRQLKSKEVADLDRDEIGPGGLYVALTHHSGYGTFYMHLESLSVKHWDLVEAGQVIGTLGRSGTVKSGPHLHFELRSGSERIDPAEPFAAVLVDPYRQRH